MKKTIADRIRDNIARSSNPELAAVAMAQKYGARAVRDAKRRSPTRGRPRVHTHPAEACARLLEDAFNTATTWTEDEQSIVLALAKRVRSGEWRRFL